MMLGECSTSASSGYALHPGMLPGRVACLCGRKTSSSTCTMLQLHPALCCSAPRLTTPCCARFVELLEKALSPAWAGDGLFFSYHIDLTLSQQRYAARESAKAQGGRAAFAAADPHFCWNRFLAGPLLGGHLVLPGAAFADRGPAASQCVQVTAELQPQAG